MTRADAAMGVDVERDEEARVLAELPDPREIFLDDCRASLPIDHAASMVRGLAGEARRSKRLRSASVATDLLMSIGVAIEKRLGRD